MEIKKVRLDVPHIEAVKLTEENLTEVAEWAGGVVEKYRSPSGDKFKVVVHLMGSITDGLAHFYPGNWMIKNPRQPGQISYLGDELFAQVYTEVEAVSAGEIAEIIETTMATPSRSARSLAFEAASRVFDRIEQRTGKKIHCIHCEIDKGIDEMSPRTDGDPSSMCKDCESKHILYLDRLKKNVEDSRKTHAAYEYLVRNRDDLTAKLTEKLNDEEI